MSYTAAVDAGIGASDKKADTMQAHKSSLTKRAAARIDIARPHPEKVSRYVQAPAQIMSHSLFLVKASRNLAEWRIAKIAGAWRGEGSTGTSRCLPEGGEDVVSGFVFSPPLGARGTCGEGVQDVVVVVGPSRIGGSASGCQTGPT